LRRSGGPGCTSAMTDDDPFDLQRFVDAQGTVIEQVRRELRAGRKRSHWMWFVFPQIAGLGNSATAVRYVISSLDEALAYLAHPVLGPRLRECTQLVLDVQGRPVEAIFGHPDNLKFHSSMTLFAQAAPEERDFADALTKYFGGERDKKTLSVLQQNST
jgi:uncharacterized protein (DUF1810 family)